MRLQKLTSYLLSQPWRTVLFAVVISIFPILGLMGIVIAVLVTLCQGAGRGAVITTLVTIANLFSFIFLMKGIGGNVKTINVISYLIVLSNLFTYFFALLLRNSGSMVKTLQIATLLGVLIVSVVHLIKPDIGNWWLQNFDMLQINIQNVPSDIMMEAIENMTGTLVLTLLFSIMSQVILGRWWQSAVFNPGGMQWELHHLKLSRLAGFLCVLCLILNIAYSGNLVIKDIMPIVIMLFFVSGLSLVHFLFKAMKIKNTWAWLLIFYSLVFLSSVGPYLISIFGLADSMFDMRNRFKKT